MECRWGPLLSWPCSNRCSARLCSRHCFRIESFRWGDRPELCPFMCRFLGAGKIGPSAGLGCRRPKTAKARSRGNGAILVPTVTILLGANLQARKPQLFHWSSFDHLIGAAKQRQRRRKAQRRMLSELFASAGHSMETDRPHPPGRRDSRTDVGTERCERLRLALTLSDAVLPCRSRAWSSS